MKNAKYFILVFLLFIATLNLQIYHAETQIEGEWVNRHTFEVENEDGSKTQSYSMSPQVFWDNVSNSWRELLLVNNTDHVNPHYLVRNSHITARIGISSEWEQEGVLYYDPDFTRFICAEYIKPQAYIGSEWTTLNTTFWSHEVYFDSSTMINISGVFRVYYGATEVGRMRISYILKPASYLKHEIAVVNISPQTRQFRVVMRLVGIAGTRVQHILGDTVVTLTEQQIESYYLRFVNNTNPNYIFLSEKLDSLGHWVENATGLYWINDYLKAIRLKLVDYKGKTLVRCDIVIGNYTLDPDETLFIDPDSSTWDVGASSDDCNEQFDFFYDSQNWVMPGHTGSGNNLTNGLRFTSINIPQGSTIESAYLGLRYWTGFDSGAKHEVRISCEDNDTSDTFTSDWRAQYRTKTTAYELWNATSMTVDSWYPCEDVNLNSCVQEVVDRAGWSSNNNMSFIIDDDDQSCTDTWYMSSYDRGSGHEPNLTITWSPPVAAYNFSGVINQTFSVLSELVWSFAVGGVINQVWTVASVVESAVLRFFSGVINQVWSIISGQTWVFSRESVVNQLFSVDSLSSWSFIPESVINHVWSIDSSVVSSSLRYLSGSISQLFTILSEREFIQLIESTVSQVFTIASERSWSFLLESVINQVWTINSLVVSSSLRDFSGSIVQVFTIASERTWSFALLKSISQVFTVEGSPEIISAALRIFSGVVQQSFTIVSESNWSFSIGSIISQLWTVEGSAGFISYVTLNFSGVINQVWSVTSLFETARTIFSSGSINQVWTIVSERVWSFTLFSTINQVFTVVGSAAIYVPGLLNFSGTIGVLFEILRNLPVAPAALTSTEAIMVAFALVLPWLCLLLLRTRHYEETMVEESYPYEE